MAEVHFQSVPVVTARIADVAQATPRSRLLAIDLAEQAFEFLPGQAVTTGLHGAGERWPYSIACSPEYARDRGCIELLVALDPSRDTAGHPSRASAGELLDLEGPLGTFTFPEAPTEHRLLFVAGGIGIAPLRSMLDHVLRGTRGYGIGVIYSARGGEEFAFLDELRAHEGTGRIELFQTVTRDAGGTWPGNRGRVGLGHFEAALHEPLSTLCFVCGPPQFVTESATMLGGLGVPAALIRTEQWGK